MGPMKLVLTEAFIEQYPLQATRPSKYRSAVRVERSWRGMRLEEAPLSLSQPDQSPVTFGKKWFDLISANPHDVLFVNESIMDHFSCGRPVEATIADLTEGRVSAEDIPPIRV